MNIKVETEKKYYCMEPEKLIEHAINLNFKLTDKVLESDEYFTDLNCEFIKNRTCLRIRKTNEKSMEITYKGKSNSLLGFYCKLENNISADIGNYENYVKLFSSLGYYSYVLVSKERSIYRLEKQQCTYSIMIDKLPNIGGFVEFEIMSDNFSFKRNELKMKLDNFLHHFNEFNLKEASQPYRDIVADYIFHKNFKFNEVQELMLNIDAEIQNLEKDFFKKSKSKISELCGYSIKWTEYKKNPSVDNNIASLVDDYLDNMILDNNELLLTIELLQQIDLKKIFITNVNELFFTHLFGKLNVLMDNVIYSKSYQKLYRANPSVVFICEKDIRRINNFLLILINHQ